jgi:hypothetical protein
MEFIDFLKSKKERYELVKIIRQPDLTKSLISTTDDFDEPLDNFNTC